MVPEPSDPKGQGPLVRAPKLQVMLTFMALAVSLQLVAADGGCLVEPRAYGMADPFVNMPEEPGAVNGSCRNFRSLCLRPCWTTWRRPTRSSTGESGTLLDVQWMEKLKVMARYKEYYKYNKLMDNTGEMERNFMGMRTQQWQ